MKIRLIVTLLFSSFTIFSQNETAKDSLKSVERKLFIQDYTNQFNVKFDVSNEVPSFHIPFQNKSVEVVPNLNNRYGFVLSYKFATVRLGIRPKTSSTSENEKGEPKIFRIKFKLLFNKWSHSFEYNRIKGYYVAETGAVENNSNTIHIQFPELKTKILSVTTAYKLNDNYSIRASISQTEAQIKSAGSFIPSVTFTYYDINGSETYLDFDGNAIDRTSFSDNSGFTSSLNMGYHYNFVYRKWYASPFLITGIGYDHRNVTDYNADLITKNQYNALLLSTDAGLTVGYNAEKIFFGAAFNQKYRNYNHNQQRIEFQASKASFFVFIGYRFKAPKVVTKPIDQLEEKLPFTKTN